jgi:superfamily II DNA/RNA helicase
MRSSRNSSAKQRGPKKTYINPSKFVKPAKNIADETYQPQHKLQDFGLDPIIMRNLMLMGFDTPSPIQDQAVPAGLAGRDIVGIANTGTGKTAAFAIPVLQKLMTTDNTKALILAPTRELAEQIEHQCRLMGKSSGLDGALLIGGSSMYEQLRDLKYNPRIIIGTPGRVKDHLERGSLVVSDCNLIVLDEVDRMLDMGFIKDITKILSLTSPARQSFFFSATLDDRVRNIIENFATDVVHISVKAGDTSDNVNQNIIAYNAANKIDKLCDILIDATTTKSLIFDDTQHSVERLSKELAARGFSADSMHGGKSQPQRQRVLRKFKEGQIKVLVATDVAARGLDVSDISHVINYSLPQTYDDYVHRIGRTGRAGRVGDALTFIEQ